MSVCDAFRVQIELRPLQYSGDIVMEGRICIGIVCVCVCVCGCHQRSVALPFSGTYTGLTAPA